MTTPPDLMAWEDALTDAIAVAGLSPMTIRVYRETASTQDVAKSFAPEPALVIADQQTAGRGRLGRTWVSTPGASVLLSVCVPKREIKATHDRVSMLVGVALAKAVERLLPGTTVRLKWPNDVMIEGRKLAGILIESTGSAYIIGIGLNVTPEAYQGQHLENSSTCLTEHGDAPDRLEAVKRIVIELHTLLHSIEHEKLAEAWRSRASLGQTQTFEQQGQRITGEVIDLDADHGLVVRRDTGEMITLPAATTSVVA